MLKGCICAFISITLFAFSPHIAVYWFAYMQGLLKNQYTSVYPSNLLHFHDNVIRTEPQSLELSLNM